MKVLSLKKDSVNKGGAVITLQPEDKEDLFTIYQIIDKDDELVFRRKFTSKLDDTGKKTSTDLIKLKIKVISNEFDMKGEYLKYKGCLLYTSRCV